MKQSLAIASTLLILVGCVSIYVKPVDPGFNITNVCIEENPKVVVDGFLTVVRDGFDRHNIPTEVVTRPAPEECVFVLTYTALNAWDLVTYMYHAELRLERRGQLIGSAVYHLRHKGGPTFSKYASTKSKMDPIIDELLANINLSRPLL